MSEETFARALERLLQDAPGLADGVLLPEVDTGEGVPDLLLVRVPGVTRQEVAETLARLPAEAFLNGTGAVLSELNRRPHTVEYLVRRTGLSREYVRRAVNYLCRLGWATHAGGSLFLASVERRFPDFEITAFECKMKDTRRAVQQAIRYTQFAHKVIAVLPQRREASVRAVSELASSATLGIATFDMTSGVIHFAVRPRKCPPRSKHAHMHVLGRVIQHIKLGDRSSQRRFPRQAGGKGRLTPKT